MSFMAFFFDSCDFLDLPVPSRTHIWAVSMAPTAVFVRVESAGIVSVRVTHSTGSSILSAVATIILATSDAPLEKAVVPSPSKDRSAVSAGSSANTANVKMS